MVRWDDKDNADPVADIREFQRAIFKQSRLPQIRRCPPHMISLAAHDAGGLTRCINCLQTVCAKCGSVKIESCRASASS